MLLCRPQVKTEKDSQDEAVRGGRVMGVGNPAGVRGKKGGERDGYY